MIERPDADILMAGPLGEYLAGQERTRAEARNKIAALTRKGWIAAVVVGVLVLALTRSFQWTLTGAAAGYAIFAFKAAQARKAVTDPIKGEINGAIARALGLEFSAVVQSDECFTRAKAFGLLPAYEDESQEDQWSGLFGDRPFVLHEARLSKETGSGSNRRRETVFEGSLMSIGFNRRFIGTTLIERDGKHRGWFGGSKESIEVNGIDLHRVDMVDPRFEDVFAVWSDDGVEARYLVHPEYIERLLAVEQAYAGENIRALFTGGELTIVLESGDMFESGSLHADADQSLLEETIDQFTILAELAAKLNERPRGNFEPS
jgi:Protein of unknown function (DUF3137)